MIHKIFEMSILPFASVYRQMSLDLIYNIGKDTCISRRSKRGELLPLANVRRQQFALNNISSKTARPRTLIFGM